MDESMDTEEVGEVNSNERNTLGTQWGRRERQDRRKDEKKKRTTLEATIYLK